ncbi:MAG: dsbB 1 [Gammaproteobacteria bacterium]|nr:dsbB 1 [Gammaproteobacteria bacterium]
MLNKKLIVTYERIFNTLELTGIILMLMMAFGFQLVLHELPCPLCLLQRVGFIGIAFGFLMNLRFGLRPSHYAIVLLSALFTSFVALRQIALHVVPGTGAYGNALFGLHLYTWSFIICTLIVIATTFMLSIDTQYQVVHKRNIRMPALTHTLFATTLFIIIANLVSVLLECGLKACPDDPMHYLWLLKG